MGKSSLNISLIYFTCTFILGCSGTPDKLKPRDLIQYHHNKENGYVQRIKNGNVAYELNVKTSDYIVAREMSQQGISEKEVIERKEILNKYYNLTLRLTEIKKDSHPKQAGPDPLSEYYSFYFKDDIELIIGDQVLKPVFYQYVNYHGLAPYSDVELSFDRASINSDAKLMVHDKVAKKTISFSISGDLLDNSPQIDI